MRFDWNEAPRLAAIKTPRIWILSDIQPTSPERARSVLSAAVDDILNLDLKPDAIWCLGDALRGNDEEALDETSGIFCEQLARLDLPICYLLGNHDMDLRIKSNILRYPLWDRVRHEKKWHMQDSLEDFFFARRFGECLVIFMGDHAAEDGSWWTTHGGAGEKTPGSYPHTAESYRRLSRALADYQGPVLIASHYALPGGQKPSPLMAQLLPLPENVKLFLHGHAHIGDLVWNKDDPWEREHSVRGQALRQYNVSALESERSGGSHSALLDLGPEGPISLRIRCHQKRKWMEGYSMGNT